MFRLLCIFLTTACVSADPMSPPDNNPLMFQLCKDCPGMDNCDLLKKVPAQPVDWCSCDAIGCAADNSITSIDFVKAEAPWCAVSQSAMYMMTAALITWTGCLGDTLISSCMMCPPCKIPYISMELPRISLSLLLHIKYDPLLTDLFDILRDFYIHASITIEEFTAISMIRQVFITDLDH